MNACALFRRTQAHQNICAVTQDIKREVSCNGPKECLNQCCSPPEDGPTCDLFLRRVNGCPSGYTTRKDAGIRTCGAGFPFATCVHQCCERADTPTNCSRWQALGGCGDGTVGRTNSSSLVCKFHQCQHVCCAPEPTVPRIHGCWY